MAIKDAVKDVVSKMLIKKRDRFMINTKSGPTLCEVLLVGDSGSPREVAVKLDDDGPIMVVPITKLKSLESFPERPKAVPPTLKGVVKAKTL